MCLCTISMLYSTIQCDIIVGKITNINGDNCKLHINDIVLYFFDFYEFKICPNDPFMSLCVDDHYLFKIPSQINNIPFILPTIKYGFLIFLIFLLIEKKSVITIYSNYNVFNIIYKIIHKYINIKWNLLNEYNQMNDNYILVSDEKWIFKINNLEHVFDFNDRTIINIFGIKNIITVLDTFLTLKSIISGGIFYIPFNTYDENIVNTKCRFFNIITFSEYEK